MKGKTLYFTLLITAAMICLAGTLTIQAQTYSGQATAVRSTVTVPAAPVLTNAVNDTGPLPSAGGSITLASASATVPNIITIGASTVTASGSGTTSQSNASVATLDTNIAGFANALRVRADLVASTTQCTCPAATCTGSSTITNLRTGPGAGTGITVTGAANQTVVITVATVTLTIVINEQIVSPGSMTVNALHLTLNDTATGIVTDII